MSTEKTSLLPEVSAFLGKSSHGAFIAGEEVQASNGETFETRDPGTGETLATVASLQPEDIDRAVAAAGKAFAEADWADLPANERGIHLQRLADAVETRKEIIAQIESLDCGKLLAQARDDVQNFIDTMRYFCGLAQNLNAGTVIPVKEHEACVVRRPWGPCADHWGRRQS